MTSLITCLCYVVILGSIKQVKIGHKAHILGISNGFVIWSAVETIRDGAYAATEWRQDFRSLDELQMIVYIGVTVYWSSILWRDEPKREPLSADLIQSTEVRLIRQQPHLSSHDPGKTSKLMIPDRDFRFVHRDHCRTAAPFTAQPPKTLVSVFRTVTRKA